MNMPAPYNAHVSFANFSLKLGMIALALSKADLAWAPGWGRAITGEAQWQIKQKLEKIIQRQMWEIRCHYLENMEISVVWYSEFLQVRSALHHFQIMPYLGVDSPRQCAYKLLGTFRG